VVLVYVTLNTLEEGQRLAQLLITRHLTNCVNFHPITCTYLWEGQITTEPEVVALIKTRASILTPLRGCQGDSSVHELCRATGGDPRQRGLCGVAGECGALLSVC